MYVAKTLQVNYKYMKTYQRITEMYRHESVAAYLRRQENKELLRFITCGSVDDGKSTLIGRLLHDSKVLYEDQLSSLHEESKRPNANGKQEVDFSLLVDGLEAEREQGITIDVAYRYFSTEHRKFIIADTPGHEQYTRNMATGASTAQLAVLLVDARHGITIQTKRHSFITTLLGIRHLLVAVNKMDLVHYSQELFETISDQYLEFIKKINTNVEVTFIPISALQGDNVVSPSKHMPWYIHKPLLTFLEQVDLDVDRNLQDLRFPVQMVNRPHSEFRGYSGSISSGSLKTNDSIMVLPSRQTATIKEIFVGNKSTNKAEAPMAITVTLDKELDIKRGDFLVHPNNAPPMMSEFDAHVVWMNETPLYPGRQYEFKFDCRLISGTVSKIHHVREINTFAKKKVEKVDLNEVAFCRFLLQEKTALDDYRKHRETGSFIVIDRVSNATVAAGLVTLERKKKSLSETHKNLTWHEHRIDKPLRSHMKNQKPCLIWFTGLSGSGKSTIAGALETKLFQQGYHTYLLDGDNIRHGLNKDLGFTDADRGENIRRIGEVAKLMVDAGLIVLCAFVSPFRKDRQMVRSLFEDGEFIEVFVDAPLDVCEIRDPKGLYKKAREGLIPDFTGINSPYEAPTDPDFHLHSDQINVDECVAVLYDGIDEKLL